MVSSDSSSLLLYNARILTSKQVIDGGWLRIEQQTIMELGYGDPPQDLLHSVSMMSINVEGHWLAPGFIDMHVHGADGADVMDGTVEALVTIGQFHARHGTTAWLPTTLTAPLTALQKSVSAVATMYQEQYRLSGVQGAASVLGIHLEGPFVSSDKAGAQNPRYISAPNLITLEQLVNTAPSIIKKITLAPELPGILPLISWLTQRNVIVSLGHSDATFQETMKGIEAGATHATHLFNAMRGLHHRDGGVVGACLYADAIVCELIADGYHVSPEVMSLALRLKGPDHIALITDAISATGKPEGKYQLGGLDITVMGDRSVLADGHTLAGSTLTMDQAVRTMVQRVGVSLQDAVVMASTTPARELGLADRKGRLAIGFDADLVVLNESLQVAKTFVLGREAFCR